MNKETMSDTYSFEGGDQLSQHRFTAIYVVKNNDLYCLLDMCHVDEREKIIDCLKNDKRMRLKLKAMLRAGLKRWWL